MRQELYHQCDLAAEFTGWLGCLHRRRRLTGPTLPFHSVRFFTCGLDIPLLQLRTPSLCWRSRWFVFPCPHRL